VNKYAEGIKRNGGKRYEGRRKTRPVCGAIFPDMAISQHLMDMRETPEKLREYVEMTETECIQMFVTLGEELLNQYDMLEIVRSARIGSRRVPTLEDVRYNLPHGDPFVYIGSDEQQYQVKAYCAKEFGPTKQSKYSTMGYVQYSSAGEEEIRFGRAMLFGRLRSRQSGKAYPFVVLEALRIMEPGNVAEKNVGCVMLAAPHDTCPPQAMAEDVCRKMIIVRLTDIVLSVFITPAFMKSVPDMCIERTTTHRVYVNRFVALLTGVRGIVIDDEDQS